MKRTKYNNPTPKQAVLAFCRECVPNYGEREACAGDKILWNIKCVFYSYRLGKGIPPVNAIRKQCLYCMGGSYKSVEECPNINCSLYPFRFGINPSRKGIKSSK